MRNCLKFSLLSIFLSTGIGLVFLQSCAQMASPPGGKKDTLAPVVTTSIPLNKSKNFKGKKIELNFNEYITVKSLNQELLITPSIGNYETRIRPTGLTLVLDSALKDNTTYTFNFRNAVEDVAERNKGKNIKLVFSTSNRIDSLKIQGSVKHLLTNKKADNITVGLYPYNDTLSIDKAKPYYFVRTDTSGVYALENLAAGKYYMAAFEDANNNLIYNSAKESVDFITEPFIDLSKNETRDFKIALQNQDVLKLSKKKEYVENFHKAFPKEGISSNTVSIALSQFLVMIRSTGSKYDSVKIGTQKFTKEEAKGYTIFKNKCASCHKEPLFTNNQFKSNGLKLDNIIKDYGRMKVTNLKKDSLKFKVPSLRNIIYSMDYMHDGRFKTLKEVLLHYNSLSKVDYVSNELKTPLNLSEDDLNNLEAFLTTLTDATFLRNEKTSFKRKKIY